MDAITMLKERRSIRKFKDETIDRKVINEIIGSAVYAPSWANLQIARYTIVEDKEIIFRLADEGMMAHNGKIINKAPVVAVISYVKGKSGKAPGGEEYVTAKGDSWDMFDAGIASQTFCLAAHEKGVGTVILGLYYEDKVAEIISLPENETVAAVIPLGYEIEHPKATPRMSVDEVSRFF